MKQDLKVDNSYDKQSFRKQKTLDDKQNKIDTSVQYGNEDEEFKLLHMPTPQFHIQERLLNQQLSQRSQARVQHSRSISNKNLLDVKKLEIAKESTEKDNFLRLPTTEMKQQDQIEKQDSGSILRLNSYNKDYHGEINQKGIDQNQIKELDDFLMGFQEDKSKDLDLRNKRSSLKYQPYGNIEASQELLKLKNIYSNDYHKEDFLKNTEENKNEEKQKEGFKAQKIQKQISPVAIQIQSLDNNQAVQSNEQKIIRQKTNTIIIQDLVDDDQNINLRNNKKTFLTNPDFQQELSSSESSIYMNDQDNNFSNRAKDQNYINNKLQLKVLPIIEIQPTTSSLNQSSIKKSSSIEKQSSIQNQSPIKKDQDADFNQNFDDSHSFKSKDSNKEQIQLIPIKNQSDEEQRIKMEYSLKKKGTRCESNLELIPEQSHENTGDQRTQSKIESTMTKLQQEQQEFMQLIMATSSIGPLGFNNTEDKELLSYSKDLFPGSTSGLLFPQLQKNNNEEEDFNSPDKGDIMNLRTPIRTRNHEQQNNTASGANIIDSEQMLQSLLTSQDAKERSIVSKVGSDAASSSINGIKLLKYQQKFTSQCIQQKFIMTGKQSKLSKGTLGETCEIGESINISQTNDQASSKQYTQKFKSLNSKNLTLKAREFQQTEQGKQEIEEIKNEPQLQNQINITPNKPQSVINKPSSLLNQTIKENSSSEKNSGEKPKRSSIDGPVKNTSSGQAVQLQKTTPGISHEVQSNMKSYLANTISIQEHGSSQEQSLREKLSNLSTREGGAQQTDRPDIKNGNRLEETNDNYTKSRSYQRDDVLLQLINAQQTQKKNLIKQKQIVNEKITKVSGYYKDSACNGVATELGNEMRRQADQDEATRFEQLIGDGHFRSPQKNQQTDQMQGIQGDAGNKEKVDQVLRASKLFGRSIYTVSTHSLQQSMNSLQPSIAFGIQKSGSVANSNRLQNKKNIKKGNKQNQPSSNRRKGSKNDLLRMDSPDDEQDHQVANINKKFRRLFKDKFDGHNLHLLKKLAGVHSDFQQKRQVQNNKLKDFYEIIEYTKKVNQNVIKAMKIGVFEDPYIQESDDLPNFMAVEDAFLFGTNPYQNPFLLQQRPDFSEKTISEYNQAFTSQSLQNSQKLINLNFGKFTQKSLQDIMLAEYIPNNNNQSGSDTPNESFTRFEENHQENLFKNQEAKLSKQLFVLKPKINNQLKNSVTPKNLAQFKKIQLSELRTPNLKNYSPDQTKFLKKGKIYRSIESLPSIPQQLQKQLQNSQSQQNMRLIKCTNIKLPNQIKQAIKENLVRLQKAEKKKEELQQIKKLEEQEKIMNIQKQKEYLEKEKEKRRMQAEQRLEYMNRIKQQKEEEWQKSKEKKLQTPLFQKMEYNFHCQEQIIQQEYEEKLKKVGKFKKEMTQIVSDISSEIDKFQKCDNFPKSVFYENQAKLEQERRNEFQNQFEQKKQKKNRILQYSNYIKSCHTPSIDISNQLQIKQRIQKFRSQSEIQIKEHENDEKNDQEPLPEKKNVFFIKRKKKKDEQVVQGEQQIVKISKVGMPVILKKKSQPLSLGKQQPKALSALQKLSQLSKD